MLKRLVFLGMMLVGLAFSPRAQAQELVWVQVESQPRLADAIDRARAYASLFPNVTGYRLGADWYTIVLGPYPRAEAEVQLRDLKREGTIPADSLITLGRRFGERYFPDGGLPAPTPEVSVIAPSPDPATDPATDPTLDAAVEDAIAAIEPQAPAILEETPAEAKRAEAALSRDERMQLQTALEWFGFYTAKIDGAFGAGTRKSMAAWQEANALEATGILTTMQRETLVAAYAVAQAELGLQTVTEEKAGIEITLPLALVQFDRYEPPFAHFEAKDASGVKVILISEPGDQATLYGLYDVLQTLEIVPLDGERSRNERNFTINGRNANTASYSYAQLSKGLIKGFILIWNPADDERMSRVLAAMQSSFKPVGDRALDPGLVPLDAAQRQGLQSGLEVRRPALSRTGFYVSSQGVVLTTAEVVDQCERITFDLTTEATVLASDTNLGAALLQPAKPLSPRAVAYFPAAAARIGGTVAVSGYSYEDRLPAPVLTFGSLSANEGLNGEAHLARFDLATLAGDAGGPVLDSSGAVLGMLLPQADDANRQLPDEVAFALAATTVQQWLATSGVPATTTAGNGALAPEDLEELSAGMTVLVSCWK